MNRIMLRFRPIAPKPAAAESDSAAPPPRSGGVEWKRQKRKYVRVRGRRKKRENPPEKYSRCPSAVTLQLLPERSEFERRICEETGSGSGGVGEVNHEVAADISEVTETVVIVECVTDMFTEDPVGLGFSDEEKISGLEKDTCPGFVSDVENTVIWVNEALTGFQIKLVLTEEISISRFYPRFACRARVVQRRGQGQKWNKIMACDVWRMEFGGLAWKLDVKTALSLSL